MNIGLGRDSDTSAGERLSRAFGDGTTPWTVGGGGAGVWGAAPAQAFMRQDSEEQLRENWVLGRRDARAAYKKRYQDAVRQQKLRTRTKGSRGGE